MKNIFLNLVAMVLIGISASSCEDVIDVDLNKGEEQLVVDGWITDQPGPYTIKLTKTGPYFTNETTPRVSGAIVEIADNEGNKEQLIEESAGVYKTSQLQGKIGNKYFLNVKVEGEEYKSETEIKRVATIDSLTYVYKEASLGRDAGYFVLYHGNELPGAGDYFWFKVYRNGSLLNKPDNLTFTSDRFVDGQYIGGAELHFEPFVLNDKIRIETWSITEEAYSFLVELQAQLRNGGMFANPIANVKSNIKNANPDSSKKAVGYFGGSAISKFEIDIK